MAHYQSNIALEIPLKHRGGYMNEMANINRKFPQILGT